MGEKEEKRLGEVKVNECWLGRGQGKGKGKGMEGGGTRGKATAAQEGGD